MRPWPLAGALLAAAIIATFTPIDDATACGGFFSPRAGAERRLSLSYEQALIVHDAVKGRQHFIREIVFRATDEPFGFVVPTPTRPEVAKVAKSPFASLREKLPFEVPVEGTGSDGGGMRTLGHGSGMGTGRGVTVLDVQKIGSFTAFVLAADDASALTTWLLQNGLVTSPEVQPWLAHYVKAGFHYVAMRYQPPPSGAPHGAPPTPVPTRAEVVRISFDTPRPYYPYHEPEKPDGSPDEPRMLELWLATQGGTAQPIAMRRKGEDVAWARPFAEGARYGATSRDSLAGAMEADAALLPEGQLLVQRFVDQKRRRTGWGDVIFVPEGRDPGDAAKPEDLRKLAAVLDPTLLPGGDR